MVIATQDKFTNKIFIMHKELSIFVFVRIYCLEVVCLQTL